MFRISNALLKQNNFFQLKRRHLTIEKMATKEKKKLRQHTTSKKTQQEGENVETSGRNVASSGKKRKQFLYK